MKIQAFSAPLLLLCSLLLVIACKKDDPVQVPLLSFDELSRNDIAQLNNQLSGESILASDASGNLFQPGDIILYKTNGNRYGKLKILNINDASNKDLVVAAVTYQDNGSVYNQKDNLLIRGTWLCDLDLISETNQNGDFHWSREDEFTTNLTPRGNAVFYWYK
jgi:hypothetical protein